MSPVAIRALLALPLFAAGAALVLALGDSSPSGEAPASETTSVEAPSAQEPAAAAPELATSGVPRKRLIRGKADQIPPKPPAPPGVEAAYAKAVALQKQDKLDEALALLAPWLKRHPAWFEDPERKQFVRGLRTRIAQVAREAADDQLAEWVNVAARWGSLRDEDGLSSLEQRARASAEIIAKFKAGKERNAVMRHVRRFVLGTPARSRAQIRLRGGALNVDGMLAGIAERDAGAEIEPLPVADEEAVETRRLEELDRLRNAGALDLLDTVAGGLAWLALYQAPDGHFSDAGAIEVIKARASADPEVSDDVTGLVKNHRFDLANTALATLAFLDFRDQDLRGLFEPTLARAIQWLLKQQKPDGSFLRPGRSYYGEAITLMAFGQAAAVTRKPELVEAVRKGLAWLVEQQGSDGGYRYSSKQAGDLSVSAWVAQAIETAGWAGVDAPRRMHQTLADFVRAIWMQGPNFSYLVNRLQARRSLSPAGMLSAVILFPEFELTDKDRDTWKKDLLRNWPKQHTSLYWRYYSVRMITKLHGGLPKEIANQLLGHAQQQKTQGHLAGAFVDARWVRGAGVMGVTALTVLMFEHGLYVR